MLYPPPPLQRETPSALSPAPALLCLSPQISFWLSKPDTANFHSLHLSPIQCDRPRELKPRCPLNFSPSHTLGPLTLLSKTIIIPFQSTRPSQNSQTPSCILECPESCCHLQKQELVNKDRKFPQYFSQLWSSWQMHVYPPWRVNRVRQPRERIPNRDQQSCKQTINTVCNTDYKTLPILKQHFSWVMRFLPARAEDMGFLTTWEFITCTSTLLCSCKHTAASTGVRLPRSSAKCI